MLKNITLPAFLLPPSVACNLDLYYKIGWDTSVVTILRIAVVSGTADIDNYGPACALFIQSRSA